MLRGVPCLILVLVLFIPGCQGEKKSDLEREMPGPGGITVGMTKTEVQSAMLDEVRKLQMVGRVKNPYSTELREGVEGRIYEVMLYYSGLKQGDNQVSDDELMPIVLLEGKVVGWGWEFLDQVNGDQ
jgi:hypothetical protein